MATAEDVTALILNLSAAYRVEIDKAQVVTWARAVEAIEGDVLEEATQSWIKHSPKFPRPAEILQTAQIIINRRNSRRPALPEDTRSVKELFPLAKQGIAESRKALQDAAARGGIIQHIDDVLAEEADDA